MNEKVDRAPPDKYAETLLQAPKEDLDADAKLSARLIGGSFPASDPASAVQPYSSKYDDKKV